MSSLRLIPTARQKSLKGKRQVRNAFLPGSNPAISGLLFFSQNTSRGADELLISQRTGKVTGLSWRQLEKQRSIFSVTF